MILLQIAVGIAFIAVGYILFKTRAYARMRHENPAVISDHRTWARRALFVTIGAVVMTEVMVQANGGVQNLSLFWTHLSFAAPFAGTLIVLQWLTGLRKPTMHKVLAHVCIAAYVGTAVTGSILLINI
jgi:hypothetical protein